MSDNIFAVHGADRRCTSYRPGHQCTGSNIQVRAGVPGHSGRPSFGRWRVVRIEWDGSSLDLAPRSGAHECGVAALGR